MTSSENPEDDQIDRAIVRAIGEELQRARIGLRWTRRELVERMRTNVPVNTYACYEQGIRQCSIPRLVEICEALHVSALEVLRLTFQRLELDMNEAMVWIDLRKIIDDEREELRPLRRWAHEYMKDDALTANPDEPAVARVSWDAVRELGRACGLPKERLRSYIRDFTPESASRI